MATHWESNAANHQQEGSVPAKPHIDANELLADSRQARQAMGHAPAAVQAVQQDAAAAGSWERYLRRQLVNLAERIATVEEVRAQVCERLADGSGVAARYWHTEARRARWVARVERKIADDYRHGITATPGAVHIADEDDPC